LHPKLRNKANQKKLNQLLSFTHRLLNHSGRPYKTLQCGNTRKATIQMALNKAHSVSNSLLILPATRLNSPEYVFTGPPELKILKQRGNTPILFVNPRHDLYLPCN